MNTITIVEQLLLFVHLLAFALALSDVLREDWKLLNSRSLNLIALQQTAHHLSWLLAVLWLSGIGLVVMKIGFDIAALLANAKLLTKFIVVTALTLNGMLLHTIAFPQLQNASHHTPWINAILGAISTTSWLYASFVGVSRLIAPDMQLSDFIGFYLLLLTGALGISLLFIRPHLTRLLNIGHHENHSHELSKIAL